MIIPAILDIGMSEMLVIGIVALIVVGPKDLPMMFRKVGNFVGRARGMARDFQRAMDQAADETGIKDIGDTVSKAADIKDIGLDDVQPAMKNYADNYVKTATEETGKAPKAAASKKTAAKATAKKAVKKTAKKAAKKASS